MLVALREPSVPDFILRPQESQMKAGSVWSLRQASCSQLPHLSFGKKTPPLSVTHQEPADEMSVVCHANAQAES